MLIENLMKQIQEVVSKNYKFDYREKSLLDRSYGILFSAHQDYDSRKKPKFLLAQVYPHLERCQLR